LKKIGKGKGTYYVLAKDLNVNKWLQEN
jgi:hypothetical protein